MENLQNYGLCTANDKGLFEVTYTHQESLLDIVLRRKQREQTFVLTLNGWMSTSGHKVDLKAIHWVVKSIQNQYQLNGQAMGVVLSTVNSRIEYNEIT